LGWTLSVREIGTGGALGALLDGPAWLDRTEALRRRDRDAGRIDLAELAAAVRADGHSDVGLAVVARPRGADTAVSIAVATPYGTTQRRSIAFLGGDQGRSRAALGSASLLLEVLRRERP